LRFFKEIVRVRELSLEVEKEVKYAQKFEKGASWPSAYSIAEKWIKSLDGRDLYLYELKCEFTLDILDEPPYLAYLKIHNPILRRIYGDVEVDVYSRGRISCLAGILVNEIDLVKSLAQYIHNMKVSGVVLKKAILGFNTDSIDLLTEPAIMRSYKTGQALLNDLLKTLARRGRSKEESKIYVKLRPYKSEILISNFWKVKEFRKALKKIMKDLNITFMPGSLTLVTSRPEKIVEFYSMIIKEYLKPLANQLMESMDSVRRKIENVARKQQTMDRYRGYF